MWESGTPFADLVRDAAEGTTYRKMAEHAVDPRTEYRASHQTLWKIGSGEAVKIQPRLVRAVAAAVAEVDRGRKGGEASPVEVWLRRVQIAAAQQYIGLMADDAIGASEADAAVVVAHVPGVTAADMPRVQELLRHWAAGDKRELSGGVDGSEG
ncbi:hypothetical protein M271_26850 [Streptomyces rapamycinicus NRRL 5491]|uniref:Uncharacterized protein n=2 Tax=Streptomyces rapamycinicus TaxID=1226757 RepID=A0A0A0NQS1_STRRN|nr:hypothetical protein M271_26850 [Streptomyces rapamycinicus NRRL 5491]RLV80057.1 hypothetical protein D3C57_116770 [Streptomyces rapamycinicus NRRL 5491]